MGRRDFSASFSSGHFGYVALSQVSNFNIHLSLEKQVFFFNSIFKLQMPRSPEVSFGKTDTEKYLLKTTALLVNLLRKGPLQTILEILTSPISCCFCKKCLLLYSKAKKGPNQF